MEVVLMRFHSWIVNQNGMSSRYVEANGNQCKTESISCWKDAGAPAPHPEQNAILN